MIFCNLREILAPKKISMLKLYNETGIARSTLINLCRPDCKGVYYNTLDLLCRYLQVTPGELFTWFPYDFDFTVTGAVHDAGEVYATLSLSDGFLVHELPLVLSCGAESVDGDQFLGIFSFVDIACQRSLVAEERTTLLGFLSELSGPSYDFCYKKIAAVCNDSVLMDEYCELCPQEKKVEVTYRFRWSDFRNHSGKYTEIIKL